MGSYKTAFRMTMVGAVISAFLLIDGIVLFLTGGLNADAQPVFPVFGGSFANDNRSSGTSLLIIGVLMTVVTFVGWWRIARPLRAAERDGGAADGLPDAGDQTAMPGPATVPQHDR
jgi:hypothetical protein